MSDGYDKDLKDFGNVRASLKDLVRKYPNVFAELQRLVDQHNAISGKIRDNLKAEAKETGVKQYAGPFTADPKSKIVYDLEGVKQAVEPGDWEELVDSGKVKVVYTANKDGVQAIQALEVRYPALAKLKGSEIYKVDSPGPKSVDITELLSLG